MQQHLLIKNNTNRLTLFFAGWGMDETPFRQYQPSESDLMICYDYRSMAFDTTILQAYSSVTLIAWSMGVWAASQTMQHYPQLPIVESVAINGTLYPIDEKKGISPAVFNGTLEGLNEQTLQKFRRRMCGSGTEFQAFQAIAPHRPVEELKTELANIGDFCRSASLSNFHWDKAIIGDDDRIFLPDRQVYAWQETNATIQIVHDSHYSKELFTNYLEPV